MNKYCHCGKLKHYSSKEQEQLVKEAEAKYGEFKKIVYLENGKTYLVPIHYILVHGIKGVDLPKLKFMELNNETIN